MMRIVVEPRRGAGGWWLTALWLLSGCTVHRSLPATDWDHVAAQTDAALRVHAGDLLPPEDPLSIRVRVYVRRRDVSSAFNSEWLRRGWAVADLNRNEIHLPVWRRCDNPDAPRSPLRMLRHEWAHLRLHESAALVVPPSMATVVGAGRLPSIPWWLHEGWAGVLEVVPLEAARDRSLPLNRERALDLRYLIRRGRCPDPLRVIARMPGSPAGTADYAVAWGLVHDLLHHPDTGRQADNRERFRRYLVACRRGFYADDADLASMLAAEFLDAEGRLTADFRMRWADRTAREGAVAFRRLFVAPATDAEWSTNWLQRMRAATSAL